MAQLKIAPHLLLEALFGGCAGAEGLSLANASFDLASDCVVLDLRGPSLPAEGVVAAQITKERKRVEFVPALEARAEFAYIGLDMASGPDKTFLGWIAPGKPAYSDEWKRVSAPGLSGSRFVQRLEVKDTMGRFGEAIGYPRTAVAGDVSSDETYPALAPMAAGIAGLLTPTCGANIAAFLADKLADRQAPWPFGNTKPVSQESTDPALPITMVEPEDTGPIQAQPHVAGNLLKVRGI